ncbi:MAG: helix-hairpin-helix domain-containing protein [Synergistaceae bacterium]|jgi:competence protein ComEA|nr:helix-hairpin-helix domain-containing protein [Synergistaceae bacterium]
MIDFENLGDKRKYILAATGAIFLVTAFALVFALSGTPFPGGFAAAGADPEEFVTGDYIDEASEEKRLVVYVTGAVRRPGVYEIAQGGRVNDAVIAAGGFSACAAPTAVNLAEMAYDGSHIIVPERVPEGSGSSGVAENASAAAIQKPRQSDSMASKSAQKNAPEKPGLININTAGASELQNLPGIGPKLSQAIIDYREENGRFGKTSDLIKVRGIGQKRFDAIKDLVTVS